MWVDFKEESSVTTYLDTILKVMYQFLHCKKMLKTNLNAKTWCEHAIMVYIEQDTWVYISNLDFWIQDKQGWLSSGCDYKCLYPYKERLSLSTYA